MAKNEWKKLHFRIDGEWLTGYVRSLALYENDWDLAIKTLVDGVCDFGYDNAIALLTGKVKLVGENNLNLVSEDPKVRAEVEQQLGYQFAGTYKMNGKTYFRPYAYVTSWGKHDFENNPQNTYHPFYVRPNITAGNFNADSIYRSLHYAENPVEDMCLHLNYKGKNDNVPTVHSVLLKRVPQPPCWVSCHTTAQDALNEYVKHHQLSERGHFLSYGYVPTPETSTEKDPEIEKKVMGDIAQTLVDSGMKQSAVTGTLAAVLGELDYESTPIPSAVYESEYGWVLADGSFFACTYHEHDAMACRILRHIYNEDTDAYEDYLRQLKLTDLNCFDKRLEQDKNAVKITVGMGSLEPTITYHTKPTPAQMATCKAWCEAHDLDYAKVGLSRFDLEKN